MKTQEGKSNIAADQLRSIIERVERLEVEKAELADDIKGVLQKAKSSGFCQKTIRKIVALRKQSASERDEQEYLMDTYKRALGMTPELE
jgi:uncharacterized protein (UPF0335 family)